MTAIGTSTIVVNWEGSISMAKRSLKHPIGFLLITPLWLLSCTSINHTSEIQQAEQLTESTIGRQPRWTEQLEVQELHIGEDRILTLDQSVDLALANNRSLRADLEVIGQAQADLIQAGLLPNPMLSFMIRFPEGGGRSALDFGLSQELADLWMIPSRKHAAQALLQERILSFVDTTIALNNEVKTRYCELQYQMLAIDLQQQNLKIVEQAIESAQARYQTGAGSVLDVNLPRGRQLEAELALITLRNDYKVTQQTLLRLMGVANSSVDWKPTPLETGFRTLSVNEADLIELALVQRLDVQAAECEMESAVADFEQQKLKVISSLSLGASATRFENRAQPGRKILADTALVSAKAGELTAPEIQSRTERRRERAQMIDWIIGPTIQVPVPIFDQNQAQIAKAQCRAKELKQRFEEVQQRVIEGVRSALALRQIAETRASFFRDSLLPLQESNLQVAQQAYQTGQESILTVLLAQESLIQTRLDYASAMRDLVISSANLERQLAGQLPESFLSPIENPPTPQPSDDANLSSEIYDGQSRLR